MSQGEFFRLYNGMTKARVHEIIDGQGRLKYREPRFMIRVYDIRPAPGAHVRLRFKKLGVHWFLSHKSADAQ